MSWILSVVSFVLGGLGAAVVVMFGGRAGLLDRPTGRSSHHVVTPKGGGVGILAAFVLAANLLDTPWSFWVPAAFLSLLSFLGDRVDLSPALRVLFQFVAAAVLLFGLLDRTPHTMVGYLLPLLLAFFVVGTANAYNFMDGINGIAAVTGIIAFGLLAAFAYVQGSDPARVTLCVSISLSCLGFLPLNFPRARVFMGDVGSILLGFLFGATTVALAETPTDFLVLICFLFPFYADEALTMLGRIRDRERLTSAHRRHLYQVLANEAGFAHWKVSLGFALFQLIAGLSVWAASRYDSVFSFLLFAVFLSVFAATSYRVKRAYLRA